MAALDVFSHTSVRPEPFGLVIVEAMATGKPVVAADAGGPREIVTDGATGFLTTPGDASAHARRVCELLTDPARAAQIGQAARTRCEQMFSLQRMVKRLDQLYQSILSGHRA